jgi:hypothetical protein
MTNFFETIGGRQFQSQLLRALEKIGTELQKSNELKEKELMLNHMKKGDGNA